MGTCSGPRYEKVMGYTRRYSNESKFELEIGETAIIGVLLFVKE